MSREPISKVDTAWLRMEQPTNLMMITGIVGLDHNASYQTLLTTVEHRFLAFRRFRQKAVVTTSGAWWEIDEDFDIRGHVRRVALPGAADRVELEAYVSDLASTALDPSRPLWQFHFIENHVDGPVVVMRIHHCYADGVALVQVFLSLTDAVSQRDTPAIDPQAWQQEQSAQSSTFQRLLEPTREGIDSAFHLSHRLLDEAIAVLQDPEMAVRYLTVLNELIRELVYVLTLPSDPVTLFKGRLGVRKRVAWTRPICLTEVKALSRALGCTVNDVLISAVTGALRGYLRSRGETPSGQCEIRATVPVNLRPLEHAKELGNHFGTVYLSLPIGVANPLERLYQVRQRMNDLKAGRQATVAFGLLSALGMAPAAFQKPALDLLSDKASMVLTNVPGPAEPLYLAGAQVTEMMFWVPQTGNIGMGISILSYNGQIFFGLIADQRLVPDPQPIIDRFVPELECLLSLALMLPMDCCPTAMDAEMLLEQALWFMEGSDELPSS